MTMPTLIIITHINLILTHTKYYITHVTITYTLITLLTSLILILPTLFYHIKAYTLIIYNLIHSKYFIIRLNYAHVQIFTRLPRILIDFAMGYIILMDLTARLSL